MDTTLQDSNANVKRPGCPSEIPKVISVKKIPYSSMFYCSKRLFRFTGWFYTHELCYRAPNDVPHRDSLWAQDLRRGHEIIVDSINSKRSYHCELVIPHS